MTDHSFEDYENFIHACIYDDFETAKNYIDNGINIEFKGDDSDEFTPLLWASLHNSTNVSKYLIDNGADVNSKTKKCKTTPLHFACIEGNFELGKYLVEHGAELEAEIDGDDVFSCQTPLVYAGDSGCKELINFLIGKGADTNVFDYFGNINPNRFPIEKKKMKKLKDAKK